MSSERDVRPKTSGVPLKPRGKWPMQKGKMTLSREEKKAIAERTTEQKSDYKANPDQVVPDPQSQTTEEDYHTGEYNYSDKLPKNRGIPIPSGGEAPTRKVLPASSKQKHSYKVNWS